jgi:hypothetical protein
MKKITLFIIVAFTLSNFGANAQNLIEDWDGNGATGGTSYPNMWGWDNTSGAIPWNPANTSSGGCRYRDYGVTNGHTGFTYEDGGATSTSRQFMLRYDNSAYSTSYYSYPVTLQACKTYDFDFDFVCGGSYASLPQNLTVGIDTTKLGTGRLSSKTFTSTTTATLYRHGKYTFSTGSRAGQYYITINGGWAWFGITNLNLVESTTPTIATSLKNLSFNDITKSAEITVSGNALTNDVTISAPAGITLSRTTIPVGETPCGAKVTITYDYTQSITSGKIMFTSDTYKDSVLFTYAKPISIYERRVEVENNNAAYPVNVKSVYTVQDSIFVTATEGFSVVKAGYSPADFTAGSGSINVQINSSATIGSTGKLIFSSKQSTGKFKVDSINVEKVATYTRYYIKHKASGLVIGDHSSGLYPALTAQAGYSKQKFFLRPVSFTTTDTFYIVQDSSYRVMRKVTANNYDTEFGIPSAEAKWTRQSLGTDTFTIKNIVRGKVLGSDAITADARLYCDKDYAVGGRMVWSFVDASVPTGINREKEQAVKVYPTVTNGSFTIETKGNRSKISVYDITGKMVSSQIAKSSVTQVNIAKTGIYLLKIETSDNITKVVKVVKTH